MDIDEQQEIYRMMRFAEETYDNNASTDPKELYELLKFELLKPDVWPHRINAQRAYISHVRSRNIGDYVSFSKFESAIYNYTSGIPKEENHTLRVYLWLFAGCYERVLFRTN